MEIESDIHIFLGTYPRRSANIKASFHVTPRVARGGQVVFSNDEQPQETYFEEATWAQYLGDTSSSSGLSSDDGRASEMFPTYPASVGTRSITDDSSSVHTPEPVTPNDEPASILSSSPSSLEVQLPGQGSYSDLGRLRGYDDKLTTPHYDPAQNPPRSLTLQVDAPTRVTKKSAASRPRVVKDVKKVNQVRGTGACLKCRIQKVPCLVTDPCETCTKFSIKENMNSSEVYCIRGDLSTVAKEFSSRRFACLAQKEDRAVNDTLRQASPEFRGPIFYGRILFERDNTKASIPAALRNYSCTAPNHGGCTFSRDHPNPALVQEELVKWAELQVSSEDHRTFEGGIESFIKLYSKPFQCDRFSVSHRPQIQLLQKVHTFKSMYKVYRTPNFYFAPSNNGPVTELSFSAQAQIRGVAKYALEASERDVLAELDKYLKSKIENHERPAVWAALWQMMLVYRDLLKNIRSWHTANNAESLLNAVAVFYGSSFRTSAALKMSLDKTHHGEIAQSFEYALGLRDTFYRQITAEVDIIDHRLKALVVDPEMKVLKRRQTKKPANGKRSGADEHDDEDDVMGGC
ncbi:hypothetical protein CORC01_11033 [Colletotrichum orchidophilum]|uniref:Uncharacterized protein n=1 Tax=Colletotrichum orchidophilum TaxID=1209926 RepID=A0A1G4AWU3_9PEZI|nr:uncharacterized protein CORC01_11033 [Colletotrichum orchidophilum]OHE93630.1 hypothetical protein CORC01_11033 [Colletotrichum orchidophilum]